MKPLFLITNDDGYSAEGLRSLAGVARQMGDVVIVAPSANASGQAHSFTGSRPVRVAAVEQSEGYSVYAVEGTPVDCMKIAVEYFCPRRPDLVLSGINHGSNSSINVLYSGTMGAVIEAAVSGYNAIGFSLLDHRPDADFRPTLPYVRTIIERVLESGLPEGIALNVNFPVPADGVIRGMRLCRQSKARWLDSYEKRIDPHGRPYYWLTGHFECNDLEPDTDQWALEHGYVSVVPTTGDFTAHETLKEKSLCHLISEE